MAYHTPMGQGGRMWHMSFCGDCGVRPLPGEFWYQLGDEWYDEEGVMQELWEGH